MDERNWLSSFGGGAETASAILLIISVVSLSKLTTTGPNRVCYQTYLFFLLQRKTVTYLGFPGLLVQLYSTLEIFVMGRRNRCRGRPQSPRKRLWHKRQGKYSECEYIVLSGLIISGERLGGAVLVGRSGD